MATAIQVPVSALELDLQNPRFAVPMASQQLALEAIVQRSPAKFLTIVADIAAHGFDPLSRIGVVASTEHAKRFVALEGNRRVGAAMALESPARLDALLEAKVAKQLRELSDRYHAAPIPLADCALFESREAADRWIRLKHTGLNGGAGVDPWGSNESDIWQSRGKARSIEGQALDFLQRHGYDLSLGKGVRGFTTTLGRVLSSPDVRARVGLEWKGGVLSATHQPAHVASALKYIVDLLRTGEKNVSDVMSSDQRKQLARDLPKELAASPAHRIDAPLPLASAQLPPSASATATRSATSSKSKALVKSDDRKTVIPTRCRLNIPTESRINDLFIELRRADAKEFKNICAVGLRVFLELSCDDVLSKTVPDKTLQTWSLYKKVEAVAELLHASGAIDRDLRTTVVRLAQARDGVLTGNVFSLHQYVHNKYWHPDASRLKAAWNELQPFMEALWP